AEIAFAEHNLVEGVRLLSRSGNPASVQKAVEQALRGLWKLLPFGPIGDKRGNTGIPLLIDQLSGIETLSDEESRELKAFQAVRENDVESLTLAQSFQKMALSSECPTPTSSILALLCFSHSSHLLAPHRNSTLPEFIQKAKLVLSYIRQLLEFSQSLDVFSLHAQKLLGFEPVESAELGEGASRSPEFWIYSTSPMFEGAQKISGDITPNPSAFGLSSLAITESDTHHLALTVVRDTAQSEVQKLHDEANIGLYFYPCLDFAIFGTCDQSECGRQEVDSRELSDKQRQESFNQRTRALVVQIQLVHESERRDLRRVWIHRLYENFMPHFPPLGSAVCVDARRIPELKESTSLIGAWCEDALKELDPGSGPTHSFLSDVLIYLDVSFRINRQSLSRDLRSRRLVRPRNDLMIKNTGSGRWKYSIVYDFINLYDQNSPDAISRTVRAAHHIVYQPLTIEANVLVNILEFIGREIIVQWRLDRRGDDGVFDQLLVPRSWAFEMVKRPPLPPQQGIPRQDFMDTLYQTLELLYQYEAGSSPLYGFNGSLSLLECSVLIIRICRLIVLIANNTSMPLTFMIDTHQEILQSLSGSGNIDADLCATFLNSHSWDELWDAVRYSALNRGADELVHLSRRRGGYKPPTIAAVKSIAYSNINPELEQLLSLMEPETMLNPRVKPFVPQAQNHASAEAEEDTIELTQTATDSQLNIGKPPDWAAAEDDFLSGSQIKPQSPLAVSEIKSGKQILFCYRRYALRQQIRMKKAAGTIGACYRRYQFRHKHPMTAVEEQIRKLHDEYKSDVEAIHYPQSNAEAFRRHKRILLGFMPHVFVYLRGLERVNQKQKEANKKRLQKAVHMELDVIRIRMDACAALAKRIKALTPRIVPGSLMLHEIDTLVGEVKHVDSLRSEIMRTFGEDTIPASLEEHYMRGILMILFSSQVTNAPNPPS
ncbi:hypothetical protein FRC11_005047, partial [Ceratobasidium sp. 423]